MPTKPPSLHRVRPPSPAAPRILAGVTILSAIMNLLGTIPSLPSRARAPMDWLPLEVTRGSRLLGAAAGVCLLLLSAGLARRKRSAWFLALVLFGVSAGTHVLRGSGEEIALLSAFMAVVLLWRRADFPVKSDPMTYTGGGALLCGTLLVVFAYTALGIYLLRRHFEAVTTFGEALRAAFSLLSPYPTLVATPLSRDAAAFANSALVLEALGVLAGLAWMLAPYVERRRLAAAEGPRVEPFLKRHGRATVSYFALEEGCRYFFLRQVPGVVPYHFCAGVALVPGEPLCAGADVPTAVREFAAMCAEHDWIPAYYQVGPATRETMVELGLSALAIGEEPYFDLQGELLTGPRRARMRHGVRRAQREGVVVHEYLPGEPGQETRQAGMEELMARWLHRHGGREMHFLLGGLSFREPRDRRYFVAELDSRVVAIVTVFPVYACGTWAVDLMRRDPAAPPGVMEASLHAAFSALAGDGVRSISLGLAPLAREAEADGVQGRTERVLDFVYQRLHRFYNFRTLHAFKRGLGPDSWEPRHLVHPGSQYLPAIGLALLSLQDPRGFLQRAVRHLPPAPELQSGPSCPAPGSAHA